MVYIINTRTYGCSPSPNTVTLGPNAARMPHAARTALRAHPALGAPTARRTDTRWARGAVARHIRSEITSIANEYHQHNPKVRPPLQLHTLLPAQAVPPAGRCIPTQHQVPGKSTAYFYKYILLHANYIIQFYNCKYV